MHYLKNRQLILSCNNLINHIRNMSQIASQTESQPVQYVSSKISIPTTPRQLIQCRRRQFDLYDDVNSKTKPDDVSLASNGWKHRKAIGDHFTIFPRRNKKVVSNIFGDQCDSFERLGISPDIIKILEAMDITKPSLIQLKAIPRILTGENCLIGSQTGSGKTLAYLVPLIEQLLVWKDKFHDRNLNAPLAVIVSPSRELTCQIGDVIHNFSTHLNFNSEVIIGGRTKRMMINPEFSTVDLLVASLGAISKLTTTGIYRMSNCMHLVMDEADTLLDDSFNEKLKYFLKHFRLQYGGLNLATLEGTQLILASATLPKNLSELESILPTKSIREITVDKIHHVLEHVPQKFIRLGRSDKVAQLLKLVKENVKRKEAVMIFSNKSETCNWVSIFLKSNGIDCITLNGEVPLNIRRGSFRQFQDGFCNVISCTDIGSRGLDTTKVKHVINYEFPLHTADYIHRVGRTGRIGSPSDCYVTNFISGPREVEIVQKIEMAVRQNAQIPNVNGNITQVITNKILKSIRNDISNLEHT